MILTGIVAHYYSAQSLPKSILHPSIAEKVWLAFVRGEYGVAVMQAMKRVEIAVGKPAATLTIICSDMTRKHSLWRVAPLTDMGVVKADREARPHLFARRNRQLKRILQSHRDVNLDDPAEAIEVSKRATSPHC